jgi:hypothetical protein
MTYLSWAQKQPRLQIFSSKTIIKASLIPNSNLETRKTRTRYVRNKNPTRFYYKEEIKQGYDKKVY